jgi:hypothetical protein
MIKCQYCINWVDESLQQVEADPGENTHIFMGCRIYGFREKTVLGSCRHYVESENRFTICNSCHITVPKVCVTLGECVNCTDTDLFCVDRCIGGDERKYCTHFIRLYTEGAHLLDQDQAFELFPAIGMPGEKTKPDRPRAPGSPGTADSRRGACEHCHGSHDEQNPPLRGHHHTEEDDE